MFAMLSAVLLISAAPPANDVTAADAIASGDRPEVQLVIGTGVEDRQVLPLEEGQAPGAGDTIYAWTLLKGFGGGSVEHVWTRDGAEIARHTLLVGSPRRWRSWSHHRVRAGSYEVRVLAADGSELAKQTFTVGAAGAGGAHDAH